jgi:hypothetical protein
MFFSQVCLSISINDMRRGIIHISLVLIVLVMCFGCSSPLIRTSPEQFSDTSTITITCNAEKGNKGLLGFTDPVYVHVGLITDSSLHPTDWRYVKFKWGSTEKAALTRKGGKNTWSYTIPNIRKFFAVTETENILQVAILFRQGNCIDTACKVLRNEDRSDILIPVSAKQ